MGVEFCAHLEPGALVDHREQNAAVVRSTQVGHHVSAEDEVARDHRGEPFGVGRNDRACRVEVQVGARAGKQGHRVTVDERIPPARQALSREHEFGSR